MIIWIKRYVKSVTACTIGLIPVPHLYIIGSSIQVFHDKEIGIDLGSIIIFGYGIAG